MRGKPRKRYVLGSVEEDIMEHLSAGDLLMSFLLSGRSTRAFYREAHERARARYRDKRTIDRLERKGLVSRRGERVSLTQEGRELMEILSSRTIPATEWKGHWWVVLYDIPVSATPFRFELRRMLIRRGFRKLQHSVWIHPHGSKELESFLKRASKLRRYVQYVEVLPFADLETLADWKKLPIS